MAEQTIYKAGGLEGDTDTIEIIVNGADIDISVATGCAGVSLSLTRDIVNEMVKALVRAGYG